MKYSRLLAEGLSCVAYRLAANRGGAGQSLHEIVVSRTDIQMNIDDPRYVQAQNKALRRALVTTLTAWDDPETEADPLGQTQPRAGACAIDRHP